MPRQCEILVLVTAILGVLLFVFPVCAQSRAPDSPTADHAIALEVGKPVEREIGGGATHRYSIRLEPGQLLDATVEQKGVDVEVVLLDSDGKTVLAVDSPIDQKSLLDRFAAAGVKALTMPALAEMPQGISHFTLPNGLEAVVIEDHVALARGSDDRDTLNSIRADAYDLVINGVEIGGGSIRIHDRDLQSRNFRLLGFTPEEAEAQFGFLLGAFEYGAPPHGGIAFGFDRLNAVMNGANSIRDFIAFPKNNQGRDMMIDAPDAIKLKQLEELGIRVVE